MLEWLLAEPIEKEHGHFLNGRNIRRLQMEVLINGTPTWVELKMARRGFIGREGLDELTPCDSHTLSDENINIIKRWLANRYTSQTFPDSFNGRIGGLVNGSKAPLVKLFNTKSGRACNALYLRLDPFGIELTDGQDYELTVVALFSGEPAMEIGRQGMQDFATKIKQCLEPVEGLGPIEVIALEESDVTYAQIAKMARWQLDYISLADGAEIAVSDQA